MQVTCYAYQIGIDTLLIELMMTENQAIVLECYIWQFLSFLTNILVVVARILAALN
jgi:hypothetical protein